MLYVTYYTAYSDDGSSIHETVSWIYYVEIDFIKLTKTSLSHLWKPYRNGSSVGVDDSIISTSPIIAMNCILRSASDLFISILA